MTRRILAIPLFFIVSIATYAQSSRDTSVSPKDGFVPDAKTAEKIAEAVLIPVYGEEQISRERPFKAARHGEVWTVTGTLNCGAPQCEGGTAVVEISKTSGAIISMVHYK
jgi:NTF2 fold immunity protein